MSNPNFVSDLVAMAKAFEELPKVQEALLNTEHRNSQLSEVVQRLEGRIMELKAESDTKSEAIRKVEAERDDAELRFLESEDRTSSALSFIKTTFGSAGSLIQALEPPAPTPVPLPPAEEEVIFEKPVNIDPPSWASPEVDHTGDYIPKADAQQMGQSEPLPTSPEPSNASVSVASGIGTQAEEAPAAPTADPIVPVGSSEGSGTVTSTGATPIENASPPTTINTSGPYTDKLYVNEPHWMPLEAWLSGGGTEANYYYRH